MSTAGPLAGAAAAGIHCIKVPTPFLVGPVNCYLIEDAPLTLIDTGPNSGTALDVLTRALADRGHRLEDLELIVLTHQHIDHLGLLEILVNRSGAEVAALASLGPWLAEYPSSGKADDAFAQALMRRHGVPDDLVTALGLVAEAFRPYGSSGTVTRPLRDGDVLRLRDRSLRVLHRPGHSPTDTVFWDAEREILLAGDHLLGHISSNATVARPLQGVGNARPKPLLQYIESQRQTRELPARLVLGGHGDPITNPHELIDKRLTMHDRRARKIHRMIAAGPVSAYDIATTIWGNVAVTQAFLTLSEVLGHIDLLMRDGLVHELDGDEVVRFETLGPATRAA
ncbi:MAG TPA: MBL fold metallo-hydrolase [Solirubrobacteraceae bacterium]|nr:MBL fold metallo-hydrolase [Solirubrobacteraceae bacterium]